MHLSTDLFTVTSHIFPRVVLFDGGRYVIAASVMAMIVWLVRQTPWRRFVIQARSASGADYARELLTSFRTVLVYGVVISVTWWASNNGWIAGYRFGHFEVTQLLTFLVPMLLAHDTYFYWTHRAMHSKLLFRHFHRTHHRSVTPTPFAAYAFNVGEAFVQVGFVPLWLVFIETPGEVFLLFVMVQIVRNVMGHCGVEVHPRGMADHWFWGLFNTTTHHDLHHNGSFSHNYGLYFTWWDRLMGTEHPEYRQTFNAIKARTVSDGPHPLPQGSSVATR